MGVVSETEAAHWTAEFAKTGEVRVPPRRRVTALKTLLYGFLLANHIGAIRMALFSRPVLVVDKIGVSLGRKRLTWESVKTSESPNSLRRCPRRRPQAV